MYSNLHITCPEHKQPRNEILRRGRGKAKFLRNSPWLELFVYSAAARTFWGEIYFARSPRIIFKIYFESISNSLSWHGGGKEAVGVGEENFPLNLTQTAEWNRSAPFTIRAFFSPLARFQLLIQMVFVVSSEGEWERSILSLELHGECC